MAEPQAVRSKNSEGVPDLTGTMVGRFAIRARLGAGGMGEVYRADDTKLKRSVALKRIAPRLRTDPAFRQRFLKEAERASALADQRIASVYDVLEEKDETFLVMEFVEGSTLRARLGQPFGLEEFFPVALQSTEALVAAHEKGIVHRDIKPENIMLTPKGQVKILDFGVAKRLPGPGDQTDSGGTSSGAGALSGTPAYMAPEVLREKGSDQRADIFSLGVVFYEMLAGKHPFRAESFVATCENILREDPAPVGRLNPRVPARLENIVERMLAKDPKNRPASAAEVLAGLRALEREEAHPAAVPSPLRARWRRLQFMLPVALMVVVLLGLALTASVRREVGRWLGAAVVPEKKNLAVLPFTVTGGPVESVAFANGLTETMNARLTRLTERHPLLVIPAGEVRAQKVHTLDDARREFGVNLVIEGSLQQAGDMVRVSYALVDATTRRQLRADTITAALADPFAMEDRVVASVLDNLEIELEPAERRGLAAHGTSQPAAYEFYLQGRGYLQEYHKPENVESAISLFERALGQDPGYALAYAGLGEAYWWKYDYSKDPQWVPRAEESCQRAAALDRSLAAAQVCLGTVHNGTGRFEQAREEFQRALELDTVSDDASRGLAFAYQQLGKTPEAEKIFLRAISLRPGYWANYNWLGQFYTRAGRYAEAAKMFERVVQLTPDNHRGYYNLGAAYYLLQRWSDAEAMLRKSLALERSATAYSNLGTIYFFEGRYGEAARVFREAVALSPRDSWTWGNLADAYRWAPGENAKAGEAYEKAIALAENQLKVDPHDAETLAELALYQAKTGRKAEAMRNAQKALAQNAKNPTCSYYAAVVHYLIGNQRQSLRLLRKAVEDGYPVKEIRADPEWGELRSRPIFQKTLGLP